MMGREMSEIRPVGEFGSKEWCVACAGEGVKILRDADLPSGLEWGFSEIYTHAPERLLAGDREISAYYFMVKDGEVTGGDGAPDECRALPGFHVKIQWAAICNQSQSKYGRKGQKQRSEEERSLFQEIAEFLGRSNPLGLGGGPKAIWPKEIGEALGKGSEEGGGLHNIAASLQIPSPEFADLPTTQLGVPVFSQMTDDRKKSFLRLCGIQI